MDRGHDHRFGRAAALCVAAGVLVWPSASLGQTIQPSLRAMVQIVATRGDDTLRGSGFIVALDRQRGIATVLTSSHVVSGAKVQVRYAADPVAPSAPAEILNVDSDNPNSLAVILVRGSVPPTATALALAAAGTPRPEEGRSRLVLIGYPSMSSSPLVTTVNFSGQQGLLYVVDRGVEEGSSGGPVLADDKVIGVVSSTTAQRTFFVPLQTIRTFLEGSNVSIAPTTSTAVSGPTPAAPTNVRIPTPPVAAPASTPATTRQWLAPTRFTSAANPRNQFLMTSPTTWGEYDFGLTQEPRFSFREAARDADYVTIWDDSRNLGIRLPLRGAPTLLNQNGRWVQWTPIQPTIVTFTTEVTGGYVGACGLQAGPDGPETALVIENRSANNLALFWVAAPGDERLYQTIAPNGTVTQSSFINHQWCIRSQDSRFEIAGIAATASTSRVLVR